MTYSAGSNQRSLIQNVGGIGNLINDANRRVQDLMENPGFEGDEIDAYPEYLVNEYRMLLDQYNRAHYDSTIDSYSDTNAFDNIVDNLSSIEQNFPLISERLSRDERINTPQRQASSSSEPSYPTRYSNALDDIEPGLYSVDSKKQVKQKSSPKSLLRNAVSKINTSAPVQNAKDFSKTFAENLRTSLNLDAPVYDRTQFPVGSNPNLSKLMLLQTEGANEYSPTMGTTVTFEPYYGGSQQLTFEGPAGFEDVRSLKKQEIPRFAKAIAAGKQELDARNKVKQLQAEGIDVDFSDVINPEEYKASRSSLDLRFMTDSEILEDINLKKNRLDKLVSSVNKMENPFYKDFLKYQLGSRIEPTPVGASITQKPIGGPVEVDVTGRVTGGRDVLYTRMSNRALISDKRGRARAQRLGPDKWNNILDEEVIWNPSELKDPALRTALGVPKGSDVSAYRVPEFQPQPLFENYNPNKSPIFKDSPQFKLPRAVVASSISTLPDVIPSAEVIKATAEGGPLAGLGEYAKEQVIAIPTGAAVGLGTYLVPGALRFVPGIAGGVALTEAGRSLQEASRQLTGESALSKIQQTIGTKPRTGFSTSTLQEKYQRAQQRVNNPPQIKPLTKPVPKSDTINKQSSPMDEFKRRARMAGSRFNPLKGEFGLTEMLFGR